MNENKFFRKLSMDRESYATVGIPTKIVKIWKEKGYSNVIIDYDPEKDEAILRGI